MQHRMETVCVFMAVKWLRRNIHVLVVTHGYRPFRQHYAILSSLLKETQKLHCIKSSKMHRIMSHAHLIIDKLPLTKYNRY